MMSFATTSSKVVFEPRRSSMVVAFESDVSCDMEPSSLSLKCGALGLCSGQPAGHPPGATRLGQCATTDASSLTTLRPPDSPEVDGPQPTTDNWSPQGLALQQLPHRYRRRPLSAGPTVLNDSSIAAPSSTTTASLQTWGSTAETNQRAFSEAIRLSVAICVNLQAPEPGGRSTPRCSSSPDSLDEATHGGRGCRLLMPLPSSPRYMPYHQPQYPQHPPHHHPQHHPPSQHTGETAPKPISLRQLLVETAAGAGVQSTASITAGLPHLGRYGIGPLGGGGDGADCGVCGSDGHAHSSGALVPPGASGSSLVFPRHYHSSGSGHGGFCDQGRRAVAWGADRDGDGDLEPRERPLGMLQPLSLSSKLMSQQQQQHQGRHHWEQQQAWQQGNEHPEVQLQPPVETVEVVQQQSLVHGDLLDVAGLVASTAITSAAAATRRTTTAGTDTAMSSNGDSRRGRASCVTAGGRLIGAGSGGLMLAGVKLAVYSAGRPKVGVADEVEEPRACKGTAPAAPRPHGSAGRGGGDSISSRGQGMAPMTRPQPRGDQSAACAAIAMAAATSAVAAAVTSAAPGFGSGPSEAAPTGAAGSPPLSSPAVAAPLAAEATDRQASTKAGGWRLQPPDGVARRSAGAAPFPSHALFRCGHDREGSTRSLRPPRSLGERQYFGTAMDASGRGPAPAAGASPEPSGQAAERGGGGGDSRSGITTTNVSAASGGSGRVQGPGVAQAKLHPRHCTQQRPSSASDPILTLRTAGTTTYSKGSADGARSGGDGAGTGAPGLARGPVKARASPSSSPKVASDTTAHAGTSSAVPAPALAPSSEASDPADVGSTRPGPCRYATAPDTPGPTATAAAAAAPPPPLRLACASTASMELSCATGSFTRRGGVTAAAATAGSPSSLSSSDQALRLISCTLKATDIKRAPGARSARVCTPEELSRRLLAESGGAATKVLLTRAAGGTADLPPPASKSSRGVFPPIAEDEVGPGSEGGGLQGDGRTRRRSGEAPPRAACGCVVM